MPPPPPPRARPRFQWQRRGGGGEGRARSAQRPLAPPRPRSAARCAPSGARAGGERGCGHSHVREGAARGHPLREQRTVSLHLRREQQPSFAPREEAAPRVCSHEEGSAPCFCTRKGCLHPCIRTHKRSSTLHTHMCSRCASRARSPGWEQCCASRSACCPRASAYPHLTAVHGGGCSLGLGPYFSSWSSHTAPHLGRATGKRQAPSSEEQVQSRRWHGTPWGAAGAVCSAGNLCYPRSVSATGFREEHFASFFLAANEVSPEALATLSTEINVFSCVTEFQRHSLILPAEGGLSSPVGAGEENKSLR